MMSYVDMTRHILFSKASTAFLSDDFVSFKLDIDHPDTEIPIALSLLQDPNLAAMVDEFFFELHFR